MSSLYPSTAQPNRGIFVETRLRKLVATGRIEARVIAPVPWFPFRGSRFGSYGAFAATPRSDVRHGIPVSYPRYLIVPKLSLQYQAQSYLRALRTALRTQQLSCADFDLIDAQYFYPDGVAGVALARELAKPVAVTALGSDLNIIADLPGARASVQDALKTANQVITVSEALATRARELGAPASRVTVLRNGVDPELFRPADGAKWRALAPTAKPLLLSVANLVPLKGHDLTIRTLKEIDGAELLIAGEGPQRRALEALAAQIGVTHRVHFLGRLAQTELAALYSAADIFVLASEREGWPNVLLEAMACGTPVVSSKVGGVPEFVDTRETGVLVGARSVTGFAAGIRQLFASLPVRATVRAHALKFGWDDVISRQVALYYRLAGA